jgi:predicted ATPase/Tfp pilus assembly protein PilF
MAQPTLHDSLKPAGRFGTLLRRYRTAAGLTQEELAERAGLSVRGISDLERGVNRAAHRATIQQLADALDLSPADRLALEAAVTRRRGPQLETGRPASPTAPTSLPTGRFLGALPEGALIAREEELGRLLSAVDAVEGGSGRLVLLAGEPGVGKTRLAQEVTRHVYERGFLVASGRCYEPQQSVPYYPFLDVLSAVYRAASPSIQADVGRRWPYLGRLLPDLVTDRGRESGSGQDEQQELFRAITNFLEAVAEIVPVAILLDDLHWADDSSLMLITHVVRHSYSSRLLIVGTYRHVEARRRHALSSAIADLSREGLVENMMVHGLKEEGTAALIAAAMGEAGVSDEFAELVHRRTDGNPFFVNQVLRALVERGDVYRQGGYWLRRALEDMELPESVRAAIWQRLSRLSSATQQILSEASVLGQVFIFDALQGLGDRTEEEIEEALEEAAGSGLIRQSAGWDAAGEECAFDHVLTQEALYAELAPRRRRRLHLTRAEALEHSSRAPRPAGHRETRPAELAWHFRRGGDAMRAWPYAMLAGSQGEAVFAHSEAEWHYRIALELAGQCGNQSWEAAALEKLGGVLRVAARYDEALEALEQAATMHRAANDLEGEARIVRAIVEVHFVRGKFDEGVERVQPLLDAQAGRELPPDLAVLLAYQQATHFWMAGKYREYLEVVQRAADRARSAEDLKSLAIHQASCGVALRVLGRMDEAVQVLVEAVALAGASGDPLALFRALVYLGEAYAFAADLDRARAQFQHTLETIEPMGNLSWTAYTLTHLGWISYILGDWQRARQDLERAAELDTSADRSQYSVLPLLRLGELCAHEGRWDEASSLLEQGLAIAEDVQDPQWIEDAQSTLAELDVLKGHPEAALVRLQPLLDRPGVDEDLSFLPPVLAWAYLELGDTNRAEEVVLKATARAAVTCSPLTLLHWHRLRGLVLTQRERWEQAERAFAEAVSMARDLPYPYAEACILSEWGRSHVRRGEFARAQERCEEALFIFRPLGAHPYIERTEQALATQPRAPAPSRPPR